MSATPVPGTAPPDRGRQRALTRSQAVVIGSILAGHPGSERERIRVSGIPPRTYQAVRRRALDANWLAERLVPDPTLFGRSRVCFALAQPSPDHFMATCERWAQIERPILLWKTASALFGVFSIEDREGDTPLARELASHERYVRSFYLDLSLTEPSLPVYFDFEAEWARVLGVPGTSFYPRPLPRHPSGSARARTAITARWKGLVGRLAGVRTSPEDPAGLAGPARRFGERASLARALRHGWMDRRAFLTLSSLPPYEEWTLGQAVLIHGHLRDGRRPEALLRTLFVSCDVHPFLFATSGGDVLMASLSPLPLGKARARRGVSVSGTLAHFLERVEVERLPAEELQTVVDHRTDLFARP